MTKTEWRSFQTSLSSLVSSREYSLIQEEIEFLNLKLKELLGDKSLTKRMLSELKNHRGEYWEILGKETKKSYLNWDISQKAKYFRMIAEQHRTILLSLKDKILISNVCKKFCWDFSLKEKIREELTAQNLYPTNYLLRNICRSKSLPSIKEDIQPKLDFSTQDSQTIIQYGRHFSVNIFGEWIDFSVKIPHYIRTEEKTGKFSKPLIFMKDKKLFLQISYEVFTAKERDSDIVLGVDLGKIKAFSSAISFKDGSFSGELTPSRECNNLQSKEAILSKEINFLYKKKEKISSLLKGRNNSYLLQHYLDIEESIQIIKNKRSKLKSHKARVISRDILNHAKENNVSEIHMEDLRFVSENFGGKWDTSQIYKNLLESSIFYGIKVYKVDAKNSSHTDPFSEEYVTPKDDRTIHTESGDLDRDYVASLELAVRQPRKLKKSRRKITSKKNIPAPKRPKTLPRSRVYKNQIKTRSGVPKFVIPSDEARILSTSCCKNNSEPVIIANPNILQL